MTTARRSALLFATLILLAIAALPAAAGAATSSPQLELGLPNPAFIEALHDPIVSLGLGRLPSPVEVSVGAGVTARAARADLPSAYSLVDLGRVSTPVKDQRALSTCWSFANIAALESKILSAQGQDLDLSEDNLIGRSGYLSSIDQRYDFGGYDFMAVAYFARWAGPVTEANDPYVSRRLPAVSRVVKHVQGAVMIPGRSADLDNDLIKQLVMANGALSVGMHMDEAAYFDGATDSYYCPTVERENHGVSIVGWDDTYAAASFGAHEQTPGGDGAFLVRNSYGQGWGDEGYFWVSYYDRSFARDLGYGTYGGCTSYSEVADVGNYSRNYGYDRLGVTDRIGYPDGSPVWAANRFTARSIRSITAVGFYTLSSGTPYEVWAGRSLKTLTRRATGTATLPGYATVKLDTPLAVTKDARFVVAIKLVSPDGSLPLAIERFKRMDSRLVFAPTTADRGQSYVGPKRWRMKDLSLTMPRANVCLKAFAR
jgi:C1A family cysteine protease